jgi:hypothetical protein
MIKMDLKKLKRQVLESDNKKVDQMFKDKGFYKWLNPETTAVECTYLITTEADISSLQESLANM